MKKRTILLILLLSVLGGNCAYYNTFYNAKNAYRDAMKIKESSPTKTAPKDLINKVIEKCGKVIKYHSRSRWVDDAIVLMGKAYIEKEEYDKALRKFEELTIYFPESPFVEEALYLTGVTYLEREEYNLAISAFEQIRSLEEGKFKDAATFKIIETYYRKKNSEELLRIGEYFLEEYPKSPYLPRALLFLGNTYLELGNLDNAIESLDKARRSAKKREDKNDIDEKYAVALIKKGQTDKGLSILRDLSERSVQPERSAELAFEIVEAYLQENNTEKALGELENYISLYPTGQYTAEAMYRKGEIYEERLGDTEAAISAYDKSLNLGPIKEISGLAYKRSTVLKEIKKYREILSNPDSTTDIPKTHFHLAETFLFGKENPDSALSEYQIVINLFPENDLAPKAAMAIAWIFKNEKNDTSEALSMFDFIIQNYPETDYSILASSEILKLRGTENEEREDDIENEDGDESERPPEDG
jgi:TolA-binding protein